MAEIILSLIISFILIIFFIFFVQLLRLSAPERFKVRARELRRFAEIQSCTRDKLVAEAKTLLERAAVADQAACRANSEASSLFKRANNRRRALDQIDVRELLVDEALSYLQERLKLARLHNVRCLTIIIGRRDNQREFKQRLRPVVEEYLERLHGVSCTKFSPFDGRLYVQVVSFDSSFDKQVLL